KEEELAHLQQHLQSISQLKENLEAELQQRQHTMDNIIQHKDKLLKEKDEALEQLQGSLHHSSTTAAHTQDRAASPPKSLALLTRRLMSQLSAKEKQIKNLQDALVVMKEELV